MIPPPSVEHERTSVQLVALLAPAGAAAGLELTGTIGIGADEHDYRVPDLALLRPDYAPQWNQTAALVVEIVSPHDESWEKLPYYAAHRVDEVVIVDPARREVSWLAREGDGYRPVGRSALLELDPGQVASHLGWRL